MSVFKAQKGALPGLLGLREAFEAENVPSGSAEALDEVVQELSKGGVLRLGALKGMSVELENVARVGGSAPDHGLNFHFLVQAEANGSRHEIVLGEDCVDKVYQNLNGVEGLSGITVASFKAAEILRQYLKEAGPQNVSQANEMLKVLKPAELAA
ncbi:MAG: hypothetical protein H6860_02325 [Rhodospirillales bacterium]|nr:hypothetical protein [Alphaproteobacteria bacterium]MCB9981217.1 hypothetical protein [Rhodospirillales bacterium]